MENKPGRPRDDLKIDLDRYISDQEYRKSFDEKEEEINIILATETLKAMGWIPPNDWRNRALMSKKYRKAKGQLYIICRKNVHGREAMSNRVRFEVFERDGFCCRYCGRKPPEAVLHVDHVIPVSKGGKNNIENLIASCRLCNLGKGAHGLTNGKDH